MSFLVGPEELRKFVPNCINLNQKLKNLTVPNFTKLYHTVPVCSKLYQNISTCTNKLTVKSLQKRILDCHVKRGVKYHLWLSSWKFS